MIYVQRKTKNVYICSKLRQIAEMKTQSQEKIAKEKKGTKTSDTRSMEAEKEGDKEMDQKQAE